MSAGAALYLAFDYGTQKIGLAIGDRLTGMARPLPSIAHRNEPDWPAIERALKDWKPAGCVVGLPLDLEGREQPMTHKARRFAGQLQQRYAIKVALVDERLSSHAAGDELRAARADGRMNRRVKHGDRDGVAARLILEQWLASPDAATDAAPDAT